MKRDLFFDFVKIISMFVIAAVHFFDVPYSYVGGSIALLTFAFSSAYLLTKNNDREIKLYTYFKNKIIRIYSKIIIVFIFLAGLFYFSGIKFTIGNILQNFFLISGIYNFINKPTEGPFGAGIWFITLLFIFYLVFPTLNRLFVNFGKNKVKQILFTLSCLFVLVIASKTLETSGISLYQTSFGFILGVYAAKNKNYFGKNAIKPLMGSVATILFAFLFNFVLNIKMLNFIFIISLFHFGIKFIERMFELVRDNKIIINNVNKLKDILMEFYLIVGYMDWLLINKFVTVLNLSVTAKNGVIAQYPVNSITILLFLMTVILAVLISFVLYRLSKYSKILLEKTFALFEKN